MKSVRFIEDHWAVLLPVAALSGLTILVIRAIRVTHGNLNSAYALVSGDNFFSAVMFLAVQSLPLVAIGVAALVLPQIFGQDWTPPVRVAGAAGLLLVVSASVLLRPWWTLIISAVVLGVLLVGAGIVFLVSGIAGARAKNGKDKASGSVVKTGSAFRPGQRFGAFARYTSLAAAAASAVGIAALGTDLWIPAEQVKLADGRNFSGVFVIDEGDWALLLQSDGTSQSELIRVEELATRTYCTLNTTPFLSQLSTPLGIDTPPPLPWCGKRLLASPLSPKPTAP